MNILECKDTKNIQKIISAKYYFFGISIEEFAKVIRLYIRQLNAY
jgi:hypothetical protein